jgi:hypothetical protein
VVAPLGQLADGVGSEELAADLLARKLPCHVLDAVLTDVEVKPVRVVRPRAARTVEAAVLVIHHEQRAKALHRLPRPLQHLPDAARRAPSRGGVVVLVARVVAHRGWAAAKRRRSSYSAKPPLLRVLPLLRR